MDPSMAPGPVFQEGARRPLRINPEPSPGFRPGKVRGFSFWKSEVNG